MCRAIVSSHGPKREGSRSRSSHTIPLSADVGFVKIDTQGMDGAVIAGMTNTITRRRPPMIVEFWPPGIEEFGDDPTTVLEFYESLGYAIGVLEHASSSPLSVAEIVELAWANRGSYVTLILRPE